MKYIIIYMKSLIQCFLKINMVVNVLLIKLKMPFTFKYLKYISKYDFFFTYTISHRKYNTMKKIAYFEMCAMRRP